MIQRIKNLLKQVVRPGGRSLRVSHQAPARRPAPGSPEGTAAADLTAVVHTVDPGAGLEQCLQALNAQTVRPAAVEMVRNVAPFPRAQQEGLDRVHTTFFAAVDEDMVLDSNCFERMLGVLNRDAGLADLAYGLEDPILGPVLGIHMYRTEAVRPIGFCNPGVKDPKRHLASRLAEAGHRISYHPEIVVGKHHPVYRADEVYRKFENFGEKIRYYDTEGPTALRQKLDQISSFWMRSKSDLALYAMAGLLSGLRSEALDRPLDFRRASPPGGFERLREVLENLENGARRTS